MESQAITGSSFANMNVEVAKVDEVFGEIQALFPDHLVLVQTMPPFGFPISGVKFSDVWRETAGIFSEPRFVKATFEKEVTRMRKKYWLWGDLVPTTAFEVVLTVRITGVMWPLSIGVEMNDRVDPVTQEKIRRVFGI